MGSFTKPWTLTKDELRTYILSGDVGWQMTNDGWQMQDDEWQMAFIAFDRIREIMRYLYDLLRSHRPDFGNH